MTRDRIEVTWDEDTAEKGGYETFMLKEIYEQADSVAETITDRLPDVTPSTCPSSSSRRSSSPACAGS